MLGFRQTLIRRTIVSAPFTVFPGTAKLLRASFVAAAMAFSSSAAITFTPVASGATFHNSAFTTEQAFNKSFVSGSNWTTSTWSTAGVPNAVGANADFTAHGSPKTLNLDAAQTAGNLRFSGSAPCSALGAGGHDQATMTWIRDGATLALQGGISSGEHFHVWGSDVGGLGAIRSLSGDNALTNVDNSGGPGYALRSQTTVGVDAGSLSVSGFYESGGS